MDTGSGSSVPRRTLGLALRQARERAGLLVKDAAAVLDCSAQTVWRIEKGEVSTRIGNVSLLCDAYQVEPDLREALIGLAKETKSRGWWHAYGDVVPTWFELYVGLEQTASMIQIYEPCLVPGLLQSADYMGSVIRADRPSWSAEQVETRIALKQSRQRLLTRPFPEPPRLAVILAESVLYARAAPVGVMRAQIWHLLKATEMPNVSIRILATAAGPHRASVSGPFTLLHFPEEKGTAPPSTIYSESLTGAIYLDKPPEIEVYRQVWYSIVDLALTEQESVHLLAKVLKELNDFES